MERDQTRDQNYQDRSRHYSDPRRQGWRENGDQGEKTIPGASGEPLWPPESRTVNDSRRRTRPDAEDRFPGSRSGQSAGGAPSRGPGAQGGVPTGWGETWTNQGQRGSNADAPTVPGLPFADERRSVTQGRSGRSAPLEPTEAERWGARRDASNGQGRNPISKRRRVITITLLSAIALCAISSVVTGVMAYSIGASAYQQANDGLTHLRTGERLLSSLSGSGFSVTTVQKARSEFAAGHQNFTQANETLRRIPSFADSAPFVGSKLQTVMNLSSVADNFSQIGVSACDALAITIGAVSNPFGKSSSSATSSTKSPAPNVGLTAADLTIIQAKLTTISGLLNDTTAQLNALQPGDLSFDPKIGAELMKVKAELPTIKQGLQDAQSIMGVAGVLLGVGTPTNYLVELLDSTEIRPGGGFIGNIGIMTLNGGVLASLHVKDVDLLDRPFEFAGGFIPFPSQYQWFPLVSNWSVRDSNLDADFPTDAKNVETNYRIEGGTDKVQGVIAITPWLIEKALAITGPIYVPEFKETVTPTNLVNLIHFHQLGPGHGSDYVPDPSSLSSQRKRFTAFLFVHFMDRVKAILGAKRGAFVKLAMSALATKDVQIYFNNPVAEQLLQKHSLASTINAPPTGDSLFVVDANVIGNKSNNFIQNVMTDKVAIDQNGMATHSLSLKYTWPKSAASEANDYGSTNFYRGYVRVYVPPQAGLISQSGWAYSGQSKAFGRLVFAGYLSLWYGGSQTITLSWRVPKAAAQSGTSWTYQELIQRQAGSFWTASLGISLPACGRVTSMTAPWQVATGATSASLKMALTEDKSYATLFTCGTK